MTNQLLSLEDLGKYCAKLSTRIRHSDRKEIKRFIINIPKRKKLSIKHVLIGLGEYPEKIMSCPSQYGYPGYKDKIGRGFFWRDYTGSEVAEWIQFLYRKQVLMSPTEEKLKQLNILRDRGFKICKYH